MGPKEFSVLSFTYFSVVMKLQAESDESVVKAFEDIDCPSWCRFYLRGHRVEAKEASNVSPNLPGLFWSP